MDELIQKLVDTVAASDGEITWEELMESVDYKDRQLVPKALKFAKANKQLKRHLMFVDGQKVHRVLSWSHPDNPKREES